MAEKLCDFEGVKATLEKGSLERLYLGMVCLHRGEDSREIDCFFASIHRTTFSEKLRTFRN